MRSLHSKTLAVFLTLLLTVFAGLLAAPASAHTVEEGLVATESSSGGDIQPNHVITGDLAV
ncbi:hypothetical protein Desku_2730 [Desulfofundulus kuznetsovii DSM 6115]|uniref:Uncharacterized protein n=1 Tax=Desulfofundulus kuznetsovii (strain DSM 6115 / VKM B-1805 / 17) TaxID=760568 RepID=A0AAU8PDR7_DESK7|nr:hypothetical protein Desku_2730 [Desulfofundulus kuznetsovii DSM 6115]